MFARQGSGHGKNVIGEKRRKGSSPRRSNVARNRPPSRDPLGFTRLSFSIPVAPEAYVRGPRGVRVTSHLATLAREIFVVSSGQDQRLRGEHDHREQRAAPAGGRVRSG